MWECYTSQRAFLGFPLELLSHAIVVGKRPEFPEGTPDDFKSLAETCWHETASARPAFKDIMGVLTRLIRSEPGQTHRMEVSHRFGERFLCTARGTTDMDTKLILSLRNINVPQCSMFESCLICVQLPVKKPQLHIGDDRMADGSAIFVAPVDSTYASFAPMNLGAAIRSGPPSTMPSSPPPLHNDPVSADCLDSPTHLQAAGIYATPADGTFYT